MLQACVFDVVIIAPLLSGILQMPLDNCHNCDNILLLLRQCTLLAKRLSYTKLFYLIFPDWSSLDNDKKANHAIWRDDFYANEHASEPVFKTLHFLCN